MQKQVRFRPDRLRKLADFLEKKVAPTEKQAKCGPKFRMNAWASDKNIGLTPNLCNTSACALGWATVPFKSAGLRLIKSIDSWMPFSVAYKNKRDFEAGAAFFGIDEGTSDRLFDPYNYETMTEGGEPNAPIKDVISRLRETAKTYKPEVIK